MSILLRPQILTVLPGYEPDVDEFDKQSSLTLQQQMELAVKESLSQALVPNRDTAGVQMEKTQLAAIRSEMAIFESNGIKGRGLQLVHDYLMSIPASSVEAEDLFGGRYTQH